jgi:NDP-sugar pyrophosphorylase family protein
MKYKSIISFGSNWYIFIYPSTFDIFKLELSFFVPFAYVILTYVFAGSWYDIDKKYSLLLLMIGLANKISTTWELFIYFTIKNHKSNGSLKHIFYVFIKNSNMCCFPNIKVRMVCDISQSCLMRDINVNKIKNKAAAVIMETEAPK